jgi:uncharacterized protein
MRLHDIEIPLEQVAEACRRAGVRRLWIFGSVLGDEFGRESDIDVLVESNPDRPAGLLALGGLVADLTDVLGRDVHLTTLGGVPEDVRPRLLASARLAYAA